MGPVDCEMKELLPHVADEYIDTKPHAVALGGTGTGVGTALGLSEATGAFVGLRPFGAADTKGGLVGVGAIVTTGVGSPEGAGAAITHICVEYALVFSKHELSEHEVAAHVAPKGTIDVVEAPEQVEVVE
jgi:hypothetical protein